VRLDDRDELIIGHCYRARHTQGYGPAVQEVGPKQLSESSHIVTNTSHTGPSGAFGTPACWCRRAG
jgi:hypothetical protein